MAGSPLKRARREAAQRAAEGEGSPLPADAEAVAAPPAPPKVVPLPPARQKLDPSELKSILEDRLARVLHYITDDRLVHTTTRDLMVSAGILFDKLQLLEGRPTAILSHEHRKRLDQVMPALVAEAQRRGLVLDLARTEYRESEPPDAA